MNATNTHITGVRTVSVPVANQDTALDLYVGTLGFTKLRDARRPTAVAGSNSPPGNETIIITLEPAAPDTSRGAIGIRFPTDDADAAHAALQAAGVETDEILRWPGVPPCSPSATPTATPSPSPNSPSAATGGPIGVSHRIRLSGKIGERRRLACQSRRRKPFGAVPAWVG